ncbi:putative ABC transporter permease [Ruminococcus flavefaciens]|uniref:putative ABC transporter permease n=1 Tax=Ruminococcus flavefaciens TaxID=1265 RepID=UPI0026F35BB1|nr:putative ABC transporter permease [Ruminococcus flavefaciens]
MRCWAGATRSSSFGPYCPIYGVGALLFLLCFGRLMRKKDVKWLNIVKPLLIFLGCMAVATAVELAASYILEYTKGSWPWQTYARYKYNFQARIALSTSVRFGLGGLLFMYIVQPLFDRLLSRPKPKTINIIAIIVLIIVVTDFIITKVTGYTPVLAGT